MGHVGRIGEVRNTLKIFVEKYVKKKDNFEDLGADATMMKK
jgi:hypothetical protein